MKMVANVRITTAVVLLLSHQCVVMVTAIPWNYEEGMYGPTYWPSLFPNYCNGTRQSPIDIQANNAVQLVNNFTNLVLTGYNTVPQQSFQLLDNGHTVQVNVGTKSIRATGASLMTGNYTLEQFHFHWGTTACDEGSEHLLNGNAYPMEIHFVHYNSDKYANVSQAVSSNDDTALMVFGVFVDVAANSTSADLDAVISQISNIREEGDKFNVVIWNVFEKPIFITLQQLAQFRTVTGDDRMSLNENYRPIQPLNGRVVSWFDVSAPSGVTSCYSSSSLSSKDCMTSASIRQTTVSVNTANMATAAGFTLLFATISCLSAITR